MYDAFTNKFKNQYELWFLIDLFKILLILVIIILMRDIPGLQILLLFSM